MAAGALLAARRSGYRVPQDLAVVGFDDTPEAGYYSPSLTTVRQPLAELGGQAVSLLSQMLETKDEDQQASSAQVVWMHPQLIVRGSSIHVYKEI